MLWSESSRPTSYYFSGESWSSFRWSSFWLLDRSGKRVTNGLYKHSEQIEKLLTGLE